MGHDLTELRLSVTLGPVLATGPFVTGYDCYMTDFQIASLIYGKWNMLFPMVFSVVLIKNTFLGIGNTDKVECI